MGFMKQNLLHNINEVTETVYNLPSVSVILPFEPKMKSKRELALALQSALDKVERKIFDKFSVDMALLVLQKLKSIIKDLDFNTHKKSVAIPRGSYHSWASPDCVLSATGRTRPLASQMRRENFLPEFELRWQTRF
jgi:hypothetical protein